MIPIDIAAGQVLLRCPACGAAEVTDAAILSGSPRIVCRNCGETWPAAGDPPPPLAIGYGGADAKAGGADDLFDAFPEDVAKAWQARIEADLPPPAPARRAWLFGGAIGAALFAALAVAGRAPAVAALPDLAGLYAAVGLPVNLLGLALEDIAAERRGEGEAARLAIRGVIRNTSAENMAVPALVAEYPGRTGPGLSRSFEPPVAQLAAGGTVPFLLSLDGVPPDAADVAVRFRRPAEPPPLTEPSP